jgi:hypothetical protein
MSNSYTDMRVQQEINDLKNQIIQLERANAELFLDAIGLHRWILENNWEEHSSGDYWHRSKDRHQWPPEETATAKELCVKYWNEKFKERYNL